MKKKQPLTATTVAALAVGFYIFDKFGGVNVIKSFRKEYPPKSEVGHMSQAAWQLKYGGSESDYQDWLLGR